MPTQLALRFNEVPISCPTLLLLKYIRDAQAAVVAFSQNITPPPLSEDMQKFVGSLATAWNSGEIRPTHRRSRNRIDGGARGRIRLRKFGRSCLDGLRKSQT
jgi:hypothetical protein